MLSKSLSAARNELARRVVHAGSMTRSPVSPTLVRTAARAAADRDTLHHWQCGRIAAQDDLYTASPDTNDFLHRVVLRERPESVLEFGSGKSTLALAAALIEVHDDDRPRVFSVDESPDYLAATRAELERHKLRARLALRPLASTSIGGVPSFSYDVDEHFWDGFLSATAPGLVFVDGPSGGGMARLATIPSVRPHLKTGALVLLDDALRDDEIAVAGLWKSLGLVRPLGVHLVGHGLLECRVC